MLLQPDRLLTKRVDPLMMKTLNAIELLELVRANGSFSRTQLAACSRLSELTVSDQVDSLVARSLGGETGPGSAGGPERGKANSSRIQSGYCQILCADIGPEWMRFAAADLGGNFLERRQLATSPEKDARTVHRNLKRVLANRLSSVSEAHIGVISALAADLNHAYSQILHTLQTVAAGPVHLSAAQR